MKSIRSWLHLLFMGVTVVPWSLVAVSLSFFISRTRMYWICARWLRLCVDAGGWIMGIHNRVQGFENLPKGERDGVILLVKHQSTWETFALPAIMPHPLAYVFKKELLRIPFFGWAIGRLDMIHIDRAKKRDAFKRVVEQGKRLLDQGTWVIMFPEGTRIPRGQQGEYKTGGARLAVETGVDVIPIAVTSAKCWPRRALVKSPGIVDISIGPRLSSAGKTSESLMLEVQTWIESEMRRLDPDAYANEGAAKG
jgi:1-acyl-sn-glycerol-3-phosphate acyltransferase